MNSIKKIIEHGLYLLVFILPIQTRWIIKPGELNGGYWEYGTVSLYATDVLLVIVLLFFIVFQIKRQNFQFPISNLQTNPKSKIQNFWFPIALLGLAIFISIFFSPSRLLAVYSYIKFLLGVGLFWLIVSAKYDKVKLIWSLIAGAAIQAGLGIWQFLSQSSFAFKWLGMAEHKPFDLGTSVVEVMGHDGIWERWLRAYGGLDHPNMLGGFLAIVSLLLIVMFINSKSTMSLRAAGEAIPAKRTNRDCFTTLAMTIMFFTFYFLLLTSLFFTFSRGAWAGFMAGLIIILAILLWQKNKKAMKRVLELIFIGFALVVFLFNMYSNLVLTRLSKDTRLEIKSNTERLESYKYAKEIIKRHWFFGVGIGNYTSALYNESDANKSPYAPFNKRGKQPSYFYQPVHNTFLLVWAEIGLLGILGFLGLLVYLIIFNFKKIGNWKLEIGNLEQDYSNKIINKNSVLSLPILSALIVMMLVDHWYWSLHFGVLFLWMVLGLIVLDFSDKECYNNQVKINKNNQ